MRQPLFPLVITAFLALMLCSVFGSCASPNDTPETAGSDDDSSNSDDDSMTIDDDGGSNLDPLRFAVEVVDYHIGVNGGYGESKLPGSVLGPPAGKGDFSQQESDDQVLSLGHGGYIVLRLGYEIIDGDGIDFIIFENPFKPSGLDDVVFTEAAVVEVSQDGIDWHRFPFDYNPDGPGDAPYANPVNFHGLAGITPVYANPNEGIDPLNPEVSGGDGFDLADVGLEKAAYVKIIDTGCNIKAPGTQIVDDNGDLVDDYGNHFPLSENKEGFDLDAVAVIHFGDPT